MDRPQFFLFSTTQDLPGATGGRWQFLLQSLNGQGVLEASDVEADTSGERLELLAVVRGLEALDQPSHVTLITTSRRVARGIRLSLEGWRANGWQWERFGRWEPIKNADLWQRIDGALQFHDVRCRSIREAVAELPWAAQPAAEAEVSVARVAAAGWHSRPTSQPMPLPPRREGWRGRLQALYQEVSDRLVWRPTRSLAS